MIDQNTASLIVTITVVVIFLVILGWAWVTDPSTKAEREEAELKHMKSREKK